MERCAHCTPTLAGADPLWLNEFDIKLTGSIDAALATAPLALSLAGPLLATWLRQVANDLDK